MGNRSRTDENPKEKGKRKKGRREGGEKGRGKREKGKKGKRERRIGDGVGMFQQQRTEDKECRIQALPTPVPQRVEGKKITTSTLTTHKSARSGYR